MTAPRNDVAIGQGGEGVKANSRHFGYSPFAGRCINCGHEVTKKSLIEHEAGEMREIRIGKTKYADDFMHLWEQLCTYARENSAPAKQYGRAWHPYKDIAGIEPPPAFQLETAAEAPIMAVVLNKIRSLNVSFVKRRRAA